MGYHVAYIPKVGFPGSQKLPVLLSAWADLMMMSWVTKQGEAAAAAACLEIVQGLAG